MIAKRIASKTALKSRSGALIRYIVDAKNDGHKAENVTITNCYSDNWLWASKEIEATQGMNTRSKADKTYHLVLSFREGERPSDNDLRAIESQVVDDLGYREHQRVSATHRDTDNLHIHIAINKIHPDSYTIHEPYYDHYTLSESCAKLEIKYGLKVDNHAIGGTTRSQRVTDVEEIRKNGITPLVDYLRDNIDISAFTSWEAAHKESRRNGVDLIKKGSGLAFYDKSSKTYVKASSVSRDLSINNLRSRFGDYVPCNTIHPVINKYHGETLLRAKLKESSPLWDEFKNIRNEQKLNRSSIFSQLREQSKKGYEVIKSEYGLKRAKLKLGKSIVKFKNRKAAYKLLSNQRSKAIADHRLRYKLARNDVYLNSSSLSWRDFLINKAESGDALAIKALRRLKPDVHKSSTAISGDKDNGLILKIENRVIKDNGHVIYKKDGHRIIDTGSKIFLDKDCSKDAMSFAIGLAKAKFTKFEIKGSDEFKSLGESSNKNTNIDIDDRSNAINGYINERNKASINISDIPLHRLFKNSDHGRAKFFGLRKIGDCYAVLIKKNDEVLVMEITKKQHSSLFRLKRGVNIEISNEGKISKSLEIKR